MRGLWILLCVSFALGATEPDSAASDGPADPITAADRSLAPAVPVATARDELDLDPTAIRGNQELPRVLTIVPWKDPSLGDLVGKPVNSLVDEALAPVDREVFRRQTAYFDQLYGGEE